MSTTRLYKVRNAYGIAVTKCCASCMHRRIDRLGARSCALTHTTVAQLHRCRRWQMSTGLRNAGNNTNSYSFITKINNDESQQQQQRAGLPGGPSQV